MWDKLTQWFFGLMPREQWIVGGGGGVLLLTLLYLLVWEPVMLKQQATSQALNNERHLHQWLTRQARLYLSDQNSISLTEGNLTAAIESSLREKGLSGYTQRIFQNEQKNTDVQLVSVPFSTFIDWLLAIKKAQVVVVSNAHIQALDKPGYVDARLVLARPKGK